MRVYISVDMEGIAGINHPHPTDPTDGAIPTSVALMVGETNAAIEGALAAGATDILVNDSHWNMYNLLPARAPPGARVLQGQKAWSMVAGARPDGGRGAVVRCRPVRRLPRAGRPPERDHRPYLLRRAGRDPPRWPADRRVRDERARPRRVGHPGRAGRRRRRAGRGGRGLAAVGRAGRGQDRSMAAAARSRSIRRSPATRSARARSARSGARPPASCGSLEPSSQPGRRSRSMYARGVAADHAAIMPGAERVGDRAVRFARPTRSSRTAASSRSTASRSLRLVASRANAAT